MTRTYVKRVRAEAEEATRRRIVDAIVALHEEVGPLRTTISAVAERAGVERLTVYRHFPDERSMFVACSSRWMEGHAPPEIPPATRRGPLRDFRRALLRLYGWYRQNARMLGHVNADADRIPVLREVQSYGYDEYLDELTKALDGRWPRASRRRRLTIRHALAFSTWRSLTDITGSDRRAVDVVSGWLCEE